MRRTAGLLGLNCDGPQVYTGNLTTPYLAIRSIDGTIITLEVRDNLTDEWEEYSKYEADGRYPLEQFNYMRLRRSPGSKTPINCVFESR